MVQTCIKKIIKEDIGWKLNKKSLYNLFCQLSVYFMINTLDHLHYVGLFKINMGET